MRYTKLFLPLILITIYLNTHAQLPVIKEPHHKPVLVNDYVRLLDVNINAGDTTWYHVHAAPSVIVFLSDSKIGAQVKGETPAQPGEVLPGQARYIDYGANPVTHRVYNSGTNVFHVMDIELVKTQPSADSCAAIQQNNFETTINEKLVRVYKFDVNNQSPVKLQKTSCAHLLVCISGNIKSEDKDLKSGEYEFFVPNKAIELTNQQNASSTCVLLELK